MLNPLAEIAGPESSFGTNLYNPHSSATGIWQDLSGTWAQYLPKIGFSTAQYPTAASAPASVQAAVNAAIYNDVGFSAWAPYDPTLASNIATAGGAGVFQAPGTLSTNPADYASLNTAGGLSDFFGQGSTVPTGSPSTVSPSTVSPASTETASSQSWWQSFIADIGNVFMRGGVMLLAVALIAVAALMAMKGEFGPTAQAIAAKAIK